MHEKAMQTVRRLYARMQSNLRWRLMWLSMLPLLLFAITWISYALIQRYGDLTAQLNQRAQLLSRQMAVGSDYAIFAQNALALQSITDAVALEPQVNMASIYAINLEPLAITRNPAARQDQSIPDWQRTLSDVVHTGQPRTLELSKSVLRYMQPIASAELQLEDIQKATSESPGRPVRGVAVVEISLDSVRTQLLKFLGGVLLILGGFIFCAWLVVSRLSAQLDRSLQSIADAARKIGAGQTNFRLGRSQIKVFDRLARDLNLMAEKLEFSQSDLERQILEATQALREQKDAAERANTAKTRFLAAASHDLRQPMHALSLLVSAAQRENDPQTKTILLRRIETGTAALSDLLNSLLDISRLDGGGVDVQQQPCALDNLMHRLQDTYQGLAEEKNLGLVFRPTKAWTRSDPALLERIVGNLLSNAIRYTPSGGTVYIAVRPRAHDWIIQVRDNGPGIPLKDQQSIFQEFVQLSNPQRDRSMGLGLGLAIVQRLIQLLGHQIELRSMPGQGATFGLRVPRVAAEQHQQNPPESGRAGDPVELHNLGIWLVEDDELVRQSLVSVLGMWGARVETFEQARTVLQRLGHNNSPPQLLITDHRLAGDMNGLALYRAILRQLGHGIPTLLVTGDTEDATLQHLSESHIQVLYKPVKPNVLMAAIKRLLVA